MNEDLSASEAARILGVSLSTLYSYVSRGLLPSMDSGTSRRKRYPQEAVLRLAARKGDAKRGGQAAVAAMHWGLPVLETHISQIANGRLLYRGVDAAALAQHATMEAAAVLLWNEGQADYFSAGTPALAVWRMAGWPGCWPWRQPHRPWRAPWPSCRCWNTSWPRPRTRRKPCWQRAPC